jgi:hypothetical protein
VPPGGINFIIIIITPTKNTLALENVMAPLIYRVVDY